MANLTPAEREQRTDYLVEVCDKVAGFLGVDPESIMFDNVANQVCVPVDLMERLLVAVGA